jgi:monoamine oxidase
VGGRNWTVRRGATLDMTDGTRQICEFDEGLYWNAGAARLPSHHQAVLGYCRELGVALEVEINANRGALLRNAAANDGKPIELRQAINDTRGEISELLGKAINRGALDQELSAHDRSGCSPSCGITGISRRTSSTRARRARATRSCRGRQTSRACGAIRFL